jgi:hypothetical protein
MKVTLTSMITTDLVKAVKAKSYDLAILKTTFFGGELTGIDPTAVYEMFNSKGGNNYFGYSAMDNDLDAIEVSLTPSDRIDAVRVAMYGLAEELPINVLYYMKSYNAYRSATIDGIGITGWIDSSLVGVWSKESLLSVHLDSRGKLNVAASAPDTVGSGQSGEISVMLTDAFSTSVADGTVALSVVSGGGSIAPASGKTDQAGKFKATYTAASVMSATDVVISITASASLADDGATLVKFTIVPPPPVAPVVSLSASPTKVIADGSTTITITVKTAGKPLAGAYVTLSAEKGLTLNTTSGTTDAAGTLTVTATGNADVYNTRAKVTAIVYKAGFLQASSETTIALEPKADTESKPINVPGFTTMITLASIGLAFVLFTALAATRRRRK